MQTAKPALRDLFETIAQAEAFRVFSSALKSAGLVETLKTRGPHTLLAPTDEAFAKLAPGTLQEWLKPENKSKLKGILTYHVLPGRLVASELIKSSSVKTNQGTSLTIHFKSNTMHVNNAVVLRTDIACDNGVIHVLDTVMIPR